MRKWPILIFLLMSGIYCQAQTSDEAVQYLDQISAGQKNIAEQLMRYISASAHSMSVRTIEQKRQNLVEATKKGRSNVEQASDFHGDSSLRDAMLHYFDLSLSALTNDYKEIAEMREEANSNYEIMQALLQAEEKANHELDLAQQQVEANIREFTSKYKINLVENDHPLSKMIEKSNEVTQYYNDIFLPLFKVNLQNIKLKETLSGNDIDAIEKERKLTEHYAQEAKEKLTQLKAYQGDQMLRQGGLDRVAYYLEEANVMGLTTIEYVKLSQELEQKKEKLESLKPKERTKELVDEYNTLVSEVNELSAELNQYANQFNEISREALFQWEQMVMEFKQRHIPKYGLHDQTA